MADGHDGESVARQIGTTRRWFLGALGAGGGSLGLLGSLPDSAAAATDDPVDALVEAMTLDQKLTLVHGDRGPTVFYTSGIPELGIPDLNMSDGPLGVRHDESTAFPATIAAAATFDPVLVNREGVAMASEAKALDVDALLGPATNINRVPVGGRTFEYYSEDPHLSGALAAAFTRGVQSEGVIATVKHFAANNQEQNRAAVNVDVSERALREIYLPAFEDAIVGGGAGAVMAAFNRVNGDYCSANRHLLHDILKGEWGFEGFVMTDYGGIHSTVKAARAGLDMSQPGGTYTDYYSTKLRRAVESGAIHEETLNEMVRRILTQMDRTGTLGGEKRGEASEHGTQAHFDIARAIVEEGSVLLKNEGVLPLDADGLDSVAIIGPTPEEFRIGGGGSSHVDPIRRVSPADGIREHVGEDVTIETVSSDPYQPIEASLLSPPDGSGNGLRGQYYDNAEFAGSPVVTRLDTDFDYVNDEILAMDGISGDFSIRWTGTVEAPVDGTYGFSVTSASTSRLVIDGETVIKNGGGQFVPATETAELDFDAGSTHDVVVEVVGGDNALIEEVATVGWDRPDVDPLADAVAAAREADVAIPIVRGSSTEGEDRDDMVLDGNQDELVFRVAGVNERTVLLSNTGGPVRMPWIDSVPSILQIWYPGQEGGAGVANLLFGEANPSGKLPMTFGETMYDYPADDLSEYPGEADVAHYDEGVFVGYRYFDERGTDPLFAFGHGESYTEFEYANAALSTSETIPASGATVSVDVTNTGDVAGTETVQVYVSPVASPVARPPQELRGFARVDLAAGETKTVEVDLGADAFRYWHPNADEWRVDAGDYDVHVAASSRDVRASERLTITEDASGAQTGGENASTGTAGANKSGGGGAGTTSGSGPGFGVGAALLALGAGVAGRALGDDDT